jgi:carboxymethylenebutenolidase
MMNVSIPHPDKPGHAFDGYLARPAKTPAPGVLILHEAYGLNQNMRDIADRFAQEGYVALAADLFSDGNRMVCMFRAFYGLLVSPLNNSTARHVRAAFEFLQHQDGVDPKRAGAIGFCMGGSYALQLACLDGSVRAISVVSGQNPKPEDALKRACPVVGSYARGDFAEASGKRLNVLLDEFNIPHDIKIYTGAKHSMMNDDKEGYDPMVAAEVWQRTLGFFGEHIH